MRCIVAVTILLGLATPAVAEEPVSKQQHVHDMSHGVMPFDMSKTTHIFRMTEQGGVQSVVSKDSAADQVAMIRQHLEHEAANFQRGDFGDPALLHGVAMPGIAQVRDGVSRIEITYAEVPNGAAITFDTKDTHLVTEIHRWFGAQLSEHGADATAQ